MMFERFTWLILFIVACKIIVKLFDLKGTKVSEKQSVNNSTQEKKGEIIQKDEKVEKGRTETVEKIEKNSHNYNELPKTNFREFKIECREKEFILPDLSEEEKNEIRRLSEVFWKGSKQILTEPTGDFRKDRCIGLLRLYDYIRSWNGHSSVYKKIEVDNGVLNYKYGEHYGTCYDGGCYSDETTEYYLCINKIPAHEFETKFKESWQYQKRCWGFEKWNESRKIPTEYMYRGELFGTDCTVFYTNCEIWLYQPFGLLDGFCIYTEQR